MCFTDFWHHYAPELNLMILKIYFIPKIGNSNYFKTDKNYNRKENQRKINTQHCHENWLLWVILKIYN